MSKCDFNEHEHTSKETNKRTSANKTEPVSFVETFIFNSLGNPFVVIVVIALCCKANKEERERESEEKKKEE